MSDAKLCTCGHAQRDHRAPSGRASAKQKCTARVGTGKYMQCGHMDKLRTEPCKCRDFQEAKP